MLPRGVLAVVAIIGAFPNALVEYHQSPEPVTIELMGEAARRSPSTVLYVITGSGGNSAAYVTDVGVVLVDTKRTGSGPHVIKAIELVTDKPVISIVNTHAHQDHTGSNAEFGPTVNVAAHENSKSHMQAMDIFKGPNVAFVPKQTFQDKLSLSFGKDRIDLYYFGPGHTNGDTIVVFPELGVAHVGDLFPGKTVPVIDSRNGGSGIGLAATLARAVSTISGIEFVISGHDVSSRAVDYGGPSMRWNDFVEYADFNRDLVAAVTAASRAGANVDQAVARLVVPDRYRGYDLSRTQPYVRAIYDELKK